MKHRFFSLSLILFAVFALPLNTFAQDSPQWHLPEGVKARLGKGSITEIKYSPDGTKLAVGSRIGVWIYDAQTGEELYLYPGPTGFVWNISFSPDGNTIASEDSDNNIRL